MSDNQLQTNLTSILTDKNNNLKPENLKQGITCLGIEGQLAGGIKQIYNSLEELQSVENPTPGEICTVFNREPMDISSGSIQSNVIVVYLPNLTDEEYNSIKNETNLGTIRVAGYSFTWENVDNVYDPTTGGYFSFWNHDDNGYFPFYRNYSTLAEFVDKSNYITTIKNSVTITNPNSPVWNYIKFYDSTDFNIYQYSQYHNKWIQAPTPYTLTSPSDLTNGYKALGRSGVITGTLNMSRKVRTVYLPAMSIQSITQNDDYSRSTYIQLNIDPTAEELQNFGDKKYLIYHLTGNMLDQALNMTFDDEDVTLTATKDGTGNWITITSDKVYRTFSTDSESGTTYYPFSQNATVKSISTARNINGLNDITSAKVSITIDATMSGFLCTNCKIVDGEGNVLAKEQVSSNKLSKGVTYMNLLGQDVEGTLEDSSENTMLHYQTLDDMNNDKTKEDGTYCVVYDSDNSSSSNRQLQGVFRYSSTSQTWSFAPCNLADQYEVSGYYIPNYYNTYVLTKGGLIEGSGSAMNELLLLAHYPVQSSDIEYSSKLRKRMSRSLMINTMSPLTLYNSDGSEIIEENFDIGSYKTLTTYPYWIVLYTWMQGQMQATVQVILCNSDRVYCNVTPGSDWSILDFRKSDNISYINIQGTVEVSQLYDEETYSSLDPNTATETQVYKAISSGSAQINLMDTSLYLQNADGSNQTIFNFSTNQSGILYSNIPVTM